MSQSSQLAEIFANPAFRNVFIFGLIIIVLYAKDKFNMPTYDREALGPFSQLPPRLLTIDARYRHGLAVYLVVLCALYIVICVLGPTVFRNLDGTQQTQLGLSFSTGVSLGDPQIWPMAAATFLVSSAAASDNSVLGRVELFIRQYAHKVAYIPSAASNLAFSLRNLVVHQWLVKNPFLTAEQIASRETSLAILVGDKVVSAIKDKPDDEELSTWVRANILFHTLKQIFNKRDGLSSTRLDYLTDLPDNRQIFQRLTTLQQELRQRYEAINQQSPADSEKVLWDIQRFGKDVSLTISVLLSQTAKNSVDLGDLLDDLGFQGVQLPKRSDHFGYVALVYASIIAATAVCALVLYVFLPLFVRESNIFEPTDYFPGLSTIFTGCLAYLALFKVLDYLRDSKLQSLEWSEGLGSYVSTTIPSSVASSILTIFLIALFFSTFVGGIAQIWGGLEGILQQVLFQLAIAILGCGFGLFYLRAAARSPRSGVRNLWGAANLAVLVHAACAALFVGSMSYIISQYNMQKIVRNTQLWGESVRQSFLNSRTVLQAQKSTPIDVAGIQDRINKVHALVFPGARGAPTANPSVGAGISGLDEATDAVADICSKLNSFQITSAAAAAPPALFNVGQPCEPTRAQVQSPDEQKVLGLANSLVSLYQGLTNLQAFTDDPYRFRSTIFPMTTAFCLALAFGLGCRHWRSWWLHEGVHDPQGERLVDTIRAKYGPDIDVDRALTTPLACLDGVTALEALRYEDLRAKLFRQLLRAQIKEFLAAKSMQTAPAAVVAGGPEDRPEGGPPLPSPAAI